MTKFRPAVLTDAGQSLATQAETGQIKLTFTKGVLSSDDLSQLGQTAIQQTSSLNPFITCTISTSNTISSNKVGLPLNFSNEQLTQDNLAKTVGVYASDGTTEYLYAICINDAPLLISAYNGSTPEALEIEFRTEVGRASTVNVTVSPMDTASKEDLANLTATASSAISSNASAIQKLSSDNSNREYATSHSADVGSLQAQINSVTSTVANNGTINSEFSTANSNIAVNSGNIASLQSSTASLSASKVQDNKDGTVTIDGVVLGINGKIDPNADVFELGAGVWASGWGYQNTLKNFPSPNGAATIYVYGISNTLNNGRKIKVIDTWGGEYNTIWNNTAFEPWEHAVTRSDITSANSSLNSLSTEISTVDNAVMEQSKINTGDDLNNYTTPGTYWCNFFVPANSPSQFGTGIYPRFKLVVTSPVGSIAHQLLYLLDGAGTQGLPNLYVRATYSGNTWNQWQAIADNGSLVTLQSSLASTYQNAVNTAKSYTDSKPSVTIAMDEGDAIGKAQSATSPGLFLYPTSNDKQLVQSYKHVLGIYSYGIGNLPPAVSITVNNPNTTAFTFNGVYGIYTPSNQTVTLHGSVTVNSGLSATTPFFNFNISSMTMNEVTTSWLNYQTMTVDTDFQRSDVIGSTNSASGTINLEGCTITLAYDGTLQPKAPDLTNVTYQYLNMGMTGGSFVSELSGPNYNVNRCLDVYVYNSGDSNSTSPIEVDLPGLQYIGWNGGAFVLDMYNVNVNGVQYECFRNSNTKQCWIRFYNGNAFGNWNQITYAQLQSYAILNNNDKS